MWPLLWKNSGGTPVCTEDKLTVTVCPLCKIQTLFFIDFFIDFLIHFQNMLIVTWCQVFVFHRFAVLVKYLRIFTNAPVTAFTQFIHVERLDIYLQHLCKIAHHYLYMEKFTTCHYNHWVISCMKTKTNIFFNPLKHLFFSKTYG